LWFQQDLATFHTSQDSLTPLERVFDDRIISPDLWPAPFPDLTPCKFYVWGNIKYTEWAPNTEKGLKENTRREIWKFLRNNLLGWIPVYLSGIESSTFCTSYSIAQLMLLLLLSDT
jgi:hypothetical protein